MASARFITTAQDAYRKAVADGDTEEARRIFRAIELGMCGETDTVCRQMSGWTPANHLPRRSRARMVAELTDDQLRKYAPANYLADADGRV